MDRLNLTYALNKHCIEKISAQTTLNTYAQISRDSLCAEQVNNRNSAGWKKANFIICSFSDFYSIEACLYGWELLASQAMNQILLLKTKEGKIRAFDWNCRELHESLDEIFERYKLIK